MKRYKSQIKEYHKELKVIEEELLDLPAGRLKIRKKYFAHAINDKEISITRNISLIRQLCRKKFLLEKQDRINHNLDPKCLVANLKDMRPEATIAALPKSYQDLPLSYFYHSSIEAWRETLFKKNPYKQEHLNYTSSNGIALRSKSELIIANLLEEHDIPYHYDVEITLGNKTIYPDFVIKNPFTSKIIIWEHFGALHKEGYEERMTNKMKLYLKHSYVPFETLIYTFEFDVMDDHRLENFVQQMIR